MILRAPLVLLPQDPPHRGVEDTEQKPRTSGTPTRATRAPWSRSSRSSPWRRMALTLRRLRQRPTPTFDSHGAPRSRLRAGLRKDAGHEPATPDRSRIPHLVRSAARKARKVVHAGATALSNATPGKAPRVRQPAGRACHQPEVTVQKATRPRRTVEALSHAEALRENGFTVFRACSLRRSACEPGGPVQGRGWDPAGPALH